MNKTTKPPKKTDRELYRLLEEKIAKKEYIFLKHAKQRLKDRSISDLDVLAILEGHVDRKRKRNKRKDKFEKGYVDWNYCIEGVDNDGQKIRVIVSFVENLMPIITVIRLH